MVALDCCLLRGSASRRRSRDRIQMAGERSTCTVYLSPEDEGFLMAPGRNGETTPPPLRLSKYEKQTMAHLPDG